MHKEGKGEGGRVKQGGGGEGGPELMESEGGREAEVL